MESAASRKPYQKHRQYALPFVGRPKEILAIQKAVYRGETVFISGKYGIGRTALVRHIAEQNKECWRFVVVDCSRSAAEICRALFLELFPAAKQAVRDHSYKWIRHFIARFEGRTYDTVIVFDNVARLSPQKLDLLRYWKFHSGFQFIAIVEPFLPEDQLAKLHGCLGPAATVAVDRLPLRRVQEFFESCSHTYNLGFSAADIRGMASATGGYPLAMTELINSEILRKSKARP